MVTQKIYPFDFGGSSILLVLAREADFGIDGFRRIDSFGFSSFFLKNDDGSELDKKSFWFGFCSV